MKLEYRLYLAIMFFYLSLQLCQFMRELFVCRQDLAQFYERPHYYDIDLYSPFAAQDA